jgi:ATP-binding cassette subfamily B protein RaxB
MTSVEGGTWDPGALFGFRKLPIILQAEAAECGVACLAMVASYFGYRVSLSEIRRRFSASLKGTTFRNLTEMADAFGLSARPLRLELDELSNLKCPAILHWDLRHYVVMKRASSRWVWIHDPARGERRLPLAKVGKSFTGMALEFVATPTFEPKSKAERVQLRDLFSRVKGHVPMIVQLALLAAVLQVFALLSPMLSQLIVDDAITKGDLDLLTTVGMGMALLLMFNAIVQLLRGYIAMYMGTQMSLQLQTNLLRHALRLPVSWFEKRHIGDIMSRFGSLGPVQDIFTTTVPAVILNVIMLIAAITMMFIYASRLALIELAAFLFFFVVRFALFPYIQAKTDEGLHLGARVQSTFIETLRGARTFKLFNRERERVAIWQNEQAQATNNGLQLARVGLWGGAGADILSGLQKLVVWLLGARMVINGEMSLGMLIAFQAYTSQFSGSAMQLSAQFFNFKTLSLHLERLADIVLADPERGVDPPGEVDRGFRGAIGVRNLSFRYAEHEPWVLRNIDFDIRPGEFVCFIGPSGQGKTTLLKLLLGLDDPQEGEVVVDGVALRRFGARALRERTGAVLQDDALFSGSICENIAFFDSEIDMARVQAAARDAQVHDEIMALPMGYSSLISDMGSTLSGGQRQRVLLARALYRDPLVIFLDEGTAHLDGDSERRVMASLRALDRTRIVVAHREAAIAGADRIFLVAGGHVTEVAAPVDHAILEIDDVGA